MSGVSRRSVLIGLTGLTAAAGLSVGAASKAFGAPLLGGSGSAARSIEWSSSALGSVAG